MCNKFAGPENIHRNLWEEEKGKIKADWEKRGYDIEFIDEDKAVIVTKGGELITSISYSYYTHYCQFIGL